MEMGDSDFPPLSGNMKENSVSNLREFVSKSQYGVSTRQRRLKINRKFYIVCGAKQCSPTTLVLHSSVVPYTLISRIYLVGT
jgi:hypothetical protein